MVQVNAQLSTGVTGLDRALRGLIPGDNIVWQVDDIGDYAPFAEVYAHSALARGRRLVYFRFAGHREVIQSVPGAEVHKLDPRTGFESFVADLHKVIEETGRGAFYIFDNLSDLAVIWRSGPMLGNFFMLTCPYLYDMEAIAYFAMKRRFHLSETRKRIIQTCQVFLDAYRHQGRLYVHPIKVQQRHSPTMYMLHVWEGEDDFHPVTESAVTAEILSATPFLPMTEDERYQGVWHHGFYRAERLLRAIERGEHKEEEEKEIRRELILMAITRDERIGAMIEKFFTIEDLFHIGRRIIGSGLIGGKSIGMLLARNILRHLDPEISQKLEPHDSFYVGSDVFYTFLVENGIWRGGQRHLEPDDYIEGTDRMRQRIIVGAFPDYIKAQFQTMLDYFGQAPIIVRSSSLLEDNFGHSFAGKYESVFLANQGSREQRLHDFMSAARTIYAGTLSEKALSYRARRGMLKQDEQMALLIQRVSGAMHGHLYYPHLAGVGFSYNPYVWSEEIDPDAGVLRLVFGLGTRAVDRVDDDYTRIVSLNDPERRPEESLDKMFQYTQRRADILDLEANQLVSEDFNRILRQSPDVPVELFASRDGGGGRAAHYFLTFERLLQGTGFVPVMRRMLRILQESYECPVDMEFTANFKREGDYKINLVQCRPLQVKGAGEVEEPAGDIRPADLILDAKGAVIGQSRVCRIDRVIYVAPSIYGQLSISRRYSIARLIGQINHLEERNKPGAVLIIGPGRWGTSSPELGIPVNFAEINNVTVIGEVVAMNENLVPDVSLGTHFFSELVEAEMLYFALFPDKRDNVLNTGLLEELPDRLPELIPGREKWRKAVRVIDAEALSERGRPVLYANMLKQRVICYLRPGA